MSINESVGKVRLDAISAMIVDTLIDYILFGLMVNGGVSEYASFN